ncbi:MAG: dihydrodipicolinate synthase family protein [Acidobacteria bacterium]|nr:dihydrodipicolinate synthase family protein [Acidobacteriota bacterium]
MQLDLPLRGITTPLATPLKNSNTLDEAGLSRLVRHVLDGGVNCLFLLGTTGEGPSLSPAVQQQVIARACAEAKDRAPVLVGITDTSFEEAIAAAETSARLGAAGVVYAGPSYFTIGQAELLDHVGRLAQRLPLPLFLYNMPSHTRVNFAPDTVRQACTIPNVVGLKDSSGDVQYFQTIRRVTAHRENFTLLMGPEELLIYAMLAGADGGVNGGSNLFPSLYTALYRAARDRNLDEALRLHAIVLEVSASIYAGTYSSSYLKGLKHTLSLLGLCEGALAEPYGALDEANKARIAASLASLRERFPILG